MVEGRNNPTSLKICNQKGFDHNTNNKIKIKTRKKATLQQFKSTTQYTQQGTN